MLLIIEWTPDEVFPSETVRTNATVPFASGRVFPTTLLADFSFAKSMNADTSGNMLNKVINRHALMPLFAKYLLVV